MEEKLKELTEAMGDLREDAVLQLVRELVQTDPACSMEIVNSMNSGMAIVGERFDTFEYFVGDLIFAGEIFTESLELLRPYLEERRREGTARQKVILATVEGDFHDIGKNIVKYIMEAHDMQVIDLGVNVPPGEIVRRTVEENAVIVALSAVLTSAITAMQKTVDAFEAEGIRDKVHIIIGGACASPEVARSIHADAYGRTPEDSALTCERWIAEQI